MKEVVEQKFLKTRIVSTLKLQLKVHHPNYHGSLTQICIASISYLSFPHQLDAKS